MEHLALHTRDGSNRIAVVFGVYNDISIKNAERVNRMSGSGVLFKNITPGHQIHQ